MAEPNQKRIRLAGGLHRTASSAQIRKDGSLVVEFYDFSEVAERHFGHDVAFFVIVSARDKQQVLSGLLKERGVTDATTDRDLLLLRLMKEQFVDYYAVKDWLNQRGIAYEKEFDSWA